MGKDPTAESLKSRDPAGRLGDLFVILAGCLGAVSFWSTALAEISGILLLLVATARFLVSVKRGDGLLPGRQGVPRCALILCGIYIAAILASILLSPPTSFSRAGLFWHPLLLPAALIIPMKRRTMKAAGILFLVSGAVSAPVTYLLNLVRDHGSALFAFTGLTTFADLLVLAGTVSVSFLYPAGRSEKPAWRFALPGLAMALALLWSAERAPVLALAAAGSARIAEAGPRPLAAWVLIAVACLLLGPSHFSEKMEWLISGNPVDRYVVWEEGLKQVPHTPLFGHGPGSYTQVLPAGAWGRFINRPPSSWHNDMLETWLDSGPLAAGAFGGLLILGVLRAARSAFRRGRRGAGVLSREPGLLFLCLASFGLVGSVVTTSVLGLAFWLLLGLTLNPGADGISPATEVPRSS
jgi:hypothetical protein